MRKLFRGSRYAVASFRNALWWHPPPVACIQDAFFAALSRWFKDHHVNPAFYGVSWCSDRPWRNRDALDEAEYIFLMTNQEFVYHARAYNAPLFTKGSDMLVERDRSLLNGKHIIVLTMDAVDQRALLSKQILHNVKPASLHIIDECDFVGSIQSLRVEQLRTCFDYQPHARRRYDFAYWGTTKRHLPGNAPSGDHRYEILKQVLPDADLSTWLIGKDFGKAKAVNNFDPNMRKLLPALTKSRATCCFQWPGFPARLTARYHEAMACGILPFAHIDYATTTDDLISKYQRIESAVDLKAKVLELRDPRVFNRRFENAWARYRQYVPTDEQQHRAFSQKLEQSGVGA